MAKKYTGDPALDAMIRAANKAFGREVVSMRKYEPANPLPTGSLALDIALGIGGVPLNKITEIFGLESSGKTSLAMSIIAQWQKKFPDRWVLVLDLEYSIDERYMQSFGINTDMVLHVRTDSAEEALQLARDLPKSGSIGMMLFDSVGGAQKAAQAQKKIGSADVGGISKNMHDVLRGLKATAGEKQCTCIFLNQITYKIGVMFGNPETTPGGTALAYYASCRLKLMAHKESSNIPGAHLIRVQCKKNKAAPPFQGNIPVDFIYAQGPDQYMDLITLAKEYELMRNTQGKCKYKLTRDSAEITVEGLDVEGFKTAGEAGMYSALKEDPDLYGQLRTAVLSAAGIRTEDPVVVSEDPLPDYEENTIQD